MLRRMLTGASCLIAGAAILSLSAPLQAADDSSPNSGAVTFAKDVAPILYENCVACHRPGETAPMSFRNYDEVRPWIKSIEKAVVVDKIMPPWHADPAHGKFANDRSLSEEQIATIKKWIATGAQKGDMKDMPPLPDFPEGWRLGEPDLVITFDEISLPAGGPDVFHDLVGTYDIPEDKWVSAIEVKPGNRKVVHHVIAYTTGRGEGGGGDGPQGWLGAWAAGMEPMVFPEGTGRMLKKGMRVIADMHYHPAETAEKDQTKIGIHFADKPLGKELINLWIANAGFNIPAGAQNHEVTSAYTFAQDSRILSFLPHMHYRGRDFTYTATYPDGRKEILLKVNNYDFNWQTVYYPEQPIRAPKGTRIDCVAHYDNSANNPNNPDPTKDVSWGNESFDEMMIGFVDFVVEEGVRPVDAKEVMAERFKELRSAHPGEIYELATREIEQGELQDDILDTIMHFPSKGTAGLWIIPIQGMALECELKEITRIGPGFTCAVIIPGQGTGNVRGTIDKDTGAMKGRVYLGDIPLVEFEGGLAK